MAKKNYVNSQELEEWWTGWLITKDEYSWEQMSNLIYKICEGVATQFHVPPDSEEYHEHVHDAVAQTLEKISIGKLKFTRGRAPVFNLITTTAFRILYSKCNKSKKQKEHNRKYIYDTIQKIAPELLSTVENPKHPKYLAV
jgi:hypothetical protein